MTVAKPEEGVVAELSPTGLPSVLLVAADEPVPIGAVKGALEVVESPPTGEPSVLLVPVETAVLRGGGSTPVLRGGGATPVP